MTLLLGLLTATSLASPETDSAPLDLGVQVGALVQSNPAQAANTPFRRPEESS